MVETFYWQKYEKMEDHPMFKFLETFGKRSGKTLQENVEFNAEEVPNPMTNNFGNLEDQKEAEGPDMSQPENQELFVDWKSDGFKSRNYEQLTEKEKQAMSCDEIFALYLNRLAAHVNPDFYLVCLRFVLGYRECLNKYGWEKKAENDPTIQDKYKEKWQNEPAVVTPPPDDIAQKGHELKARAGGFDYSTINSAEHAPEVCNEFVTIFVQDRPAMTIEKNLSIDLTRNLCHWLFQETFTTSKVT